MGKSKRQIKVKDGVFFLDGKEFFPFGGELHYFRIPPDEWEDRIDKAEKGFLTSIGAYIAWNWHEKEEGKFDFKGKRDIHRWLSIIENKGLHIIARPGPFICAEWDGGGHPAYLIPKKGGVRSLDPVYMKYAGRWLARVNRILTSHQYEKGGAIYLYQVENEFRWEDRGYFDWLEEIVRGQGITVPLVTNDDSMHRRRGKTIMNSLDTYPDPWNIEEPEQQIKKLLKKNNDYPSIAMELQCGDHLKLTGKLPTWKGEISPKWTDMLTKTVIGCGLNGINYYMYHGGTNPGYWTGQNIPTSYDFDAAIREWGELSERYYTIRLLGGFLKAFGSVLARTKPVADGYCESSDENVDVIVRAGKKALFLFVRNNTCRRRRCYLKCNVSNISGFLKNIKRLRIPQKGLLNLPPFSMYILPVNLLLTDSLVLISTTLQIFDRIERKRETTIIFYGDEGKQENEIILRLKEKPKISGEIKYREENGNIILYPHLTDRPEILSLSFNSRKVSIVSLKRSTAARTWRIKSEDGDIPFFSNIYYLRDGNYDSGKYTIALEMRKDEGKEAFLKSEEEPERVVVDGKEVQYHYEKKTDLIKVNLPSYKEPQFYLDITDNWKMKLEGIPEIAPSKDGWRNFKPGQSLEELKFYRSGHFQYWTSFEILDKPQSCWLYINGLTDEATIFINGVSIGTGRKIFEKDISQFLKRGKNIIYILLECEGHTNLGLPTPTGFTGGLFLGKKKVIKLVKWKIKKSEQFLFEEELANPPEETRPNYDDISWKEIVIEENRTSAIPAKWGERECCWYRTQVKIPKEMEGKSSCLEIAHGVDSLWVYVNGRYIGRGLHEKWARTHSHSFPIPEGFLKADKVNTIAICVQMMCGGHQGLDNGVKLVFLDKELKKGWKIKQGFPGNSLGYHRVDFDDSKWKARIDYQGKTGFLWSRKEVPIKIPQDYDMPLKLTIEGATSKVLVFFNNILIGRYYNDGPQRDFYIYQNLVREENVIALAYDGRGKDIERGKITISPYYVSRKTNLEIDIR